MYVKIQYYKGKQLLEQVYENTPHILYTRDGIAIQVNTYQSDIYLHKAIRTIEVKENPGT